MCTLTFSVSATAFAQHEQVTLNFKQVTVRQVLNEIQRQTRLSFIYNTEQTEQLGQISVEAHNESVTSLLDRIFAGTGLTWKIQEDMILISQTTAETTKRQQAQQEKMVILTGTVTDAQKNALPGVTVKIAGTSIGTSTDVNGKFQFSCPKPTTERTGIFFCRHADNFCKICRSKGDKCDSLRRSEGTG